MENKTIDRLFKPIDLVPGIGFLTNFNRMLTYNGKTEVIGKTNPDEANMRDLKRTVVSGMNTLYHAAVCVSTMAYFNIPSQVYQAVEKIL